jgi:hypothetical protein
MKNQFRYLLILLFVLAVFQHSPAQTPADLPFVVELEEGTFDDWPGLHSFAFGEWQGYWVFIGGRRNGLHGFFAATGFPESEANDQLWVMHPASGDFWESEISDLPAQVRNVFKATNPQYSQRGEYLYITGGFGKDLVSGDFMTYPYLTAVNLAQLIPLVINGGDIGTAIRQLENPAFRVCGGEMHELGEYFYQAGGHDFSGIYVQTGAPTFTQTYVTEVRKFKIEDDGTNLAIADYTTSQDSVEFHRRDFTMAPVILPGETAALGWYGGVFRPGTDLPFLNPVYISAADGVQVDDSYEQLMSQYTCAVMPVFDNETGSMYSTFFGGLSLHWYDEDDELLQVDSLVPFIDDISTLAHHADGTYAEVILPVRFDDLLGTNAKWILNPEVPHYENGVIRWQDITERTLAGYVFGGIDAVIPNFTPSAASNRLFEVYITPAMVDDALQPTASTPVISVFPNPLSGSSELQLIRSAEINRVTLTDSRGSLLFQSHQLEAIEKANLQRLISLLPAGVYFLAGFGEAGGEVVKLVKVD